MADIDIKCTNCSKITTISEFAEITLVKCNSCGNPLSRNSIVGSSPAANIQPVSQTAQAIPPSPDAAPAAAAPSDPFHPEEKKKLTLRKAVETEHAQASDPQAQQWNQISQAKAEVANRPEKHFNHTLASGILFIVLAAIFGGARYGNFLDAGMLDYFEKSGPWVVIAMHIFITLKAFKDTVFSGILCVLVPGYSFYYLFFVSDDFYTRAVIGGVLVGIGYDSAMVMNEWAQDGIQKINDLIAQKPSK